MDLNFELGAQTVCIGHVIQETTGEGRIVDPK